MTNFEKYKADILRIAAVGDRPALVNGELLRCTPTDCTKCGFYSEDQYMCILSFIKWLYEEYKEPAPKLTAKERAFCEAFSFNFNKYIERTELGNLYIGHNNTHELALDNNWFGFIKCNSKWNVADLLKLEVE